MKQYRVLITETAISDMDELYEYIAIELHAPETALGQYNRIADAIEQLSYMPERYHLFTAEPWKSRGLRRMNVDNYSVFFFISTDKVVVTNILYSASDLDNRLK